MRCRAWVLPVGARVEVVRLSGRGRTDTLFVRRSSRRSVSPQSRSALEVCTTAPVPDVDDLGPECRPPADFPPGPHRSTGL